MKLQNSPATPLQVSPTKGGVLQVQLLQLRQSFRYQKAMPEGLLSISLGNGGLSQIYFPYGLDAGEILA